MDVLTKRALIVAEVLVADFNFVEARKELAKHGLKLSIVDIKKEFKKALLINRMKSWKYPGGAKEFIEELGDKSLERLYLLILYLRRSLKWM